MAVKKPTPGVQDNQVFLLQCPTCKVDVVVTNYRVGALDHLRGIHRVKGYGWKAICGECGQAWGSEDDLAVAPSLFVLADLVKA